MDRRRTVRWASGISLALVVGTATVALGAGAFREPPVDRAGTFESIVAQFPPARATNTVTTGTAARGSVPRRTIVVVTLPNEEPRIHAPTTVSSGAPLPGTTVEHTTAPTVQSRSTTTSSASQDRHDGSKDQPSAHEPPEHEPRDD